MKNSNVWYYAVWADKLTIRWLMPTRVLILSSLLSVTPAASVACGQVVQLPSQHVFSSTGSVSVPDGGTAYLGGAGYANQGSTQSGWGPLSNRAASGRTGGSSMAVSVQVLDLDAIDEAILGSPSSRAKIVEDDNNTAVTNPIDNGQSVARLEPVKRRSVGFTNPSSPQVVGGSYGRSSQRVDANAGQWVRALAGGGIVTPSHPSLQENDIRYYVELGQRAEQAGRHQSARVYFQLARQAMSPEMFERYQNILSARSAAEATRASTDQQAARQNF